MSSKSFKRFEDCSPPLTVAEARAKLDEAEANAKTQQMALDIVYDAWQVEVEKMKPLREAVSSASSAYIDAHRRSQGKQ